MDSNYRDENPRKRTYAELVATNAKLQKANGRLVMRRKALEILFQDTVEKEMRTGKVQFNKDTSIDFLKQIGFTVQATIVTRTGDKLELNNPI